MRAPAELLDGAGRKFGQSRKCFFKRMLRRQRKDAQIWVLRKHRIRE